MPFNPAGRPLQMRFVAEQNNSSTAAEFFKKH